MPDPIDDILGHSLAVATVKALIRQVGPLDITVLIAGESGTGKELVARAIHALSRRSKGPMVTVNCGAIPEGLFESEIFGHEKGAFTSADQRRRGYFELADKGSLFLDEIAEMPLAVQVKLLRVLETGTFLRVGGSVELIVDVRVIAATNKDLAVETAQGRFRPDLYYRLKAVSIQLPPLRERSEDIPLLAQHFAREFARRNRREMVTFDRTALNLLKNHYWEGNVRELRNFIESLLALTTDSIIRENQVKERLEHHQPNRLPALVNRQPEEFDRELIYRTLLEIRSDIANLKSLVQQVVASRSTVEIGYPFATAEDVEHYSMVDAQRTSRRETGLNSSNSEDETRSLADMEREQINRVLKVFEGNRRLAAEALGISERTLYRKINQYNLK